MLHVFLFTAKCTEFGAYVITQYFITGIIFGGENESLQPAVFPIVLLLRHPKVGKIFLTAIMSYSLGLYSTLM